MRKNPVSFPHEQVSVAVRQPGYRLLELRLGHHRRRRLDSRRLSAGRRYFLAVPGNQNTIVIVQDGFLRVAAAPYTRGHNSIQILDNAKHMYFSTRNFAPPRARNYRILARSRRDDRGRRARRFVRRVLSPSTCSISRPAPRSIFLSAMTRSRRCTASCRFRGCPTSRRRTARATSACSRKFATRPAPASSIISRSPAIQTAERVTFSIDGARVRRWGNVPFKLGRVHPRARPDEREGHRSRRRAACRATDRAQSANGATSEFRRRTRLAASRKTTLRRGSRGEAAVDHYCFRGQVARRGHAD